MKASKIAIWALIALAASEIPAQAAWNNVFQPTFFGRSRRTTSNYCQSCVPVIAQSAPVMVMAPACNTCQSAPVMAFSAPAPVCAPACPPPVQQCTTNYVQRSFYQPVTTYESRSFYEPVTTYQTSFFYEAVTTMQTSFHPDPCNCGCTVAKSCPVTTYQLRSQTSPVQSWVQRCAQVPVTSYKQSFYLEPQTTCCNTNVGAPVAVAPPCPTGNCQPQQQPAAPQSPTPSYSPPPVIDQPRQAPPGPSVGTMSNFGYQPQRTASAWQPVVTLAAITPEKNDTVQGQVVRSDRTPTAKTQVLFVNASTGERRSITTNDAGRFNLGLANGSYHVYLAGSNGSAAYHSLVNVTPNQPINLINN